MDDGEPVSLLGRPLPEWCERRVIDVAPGSVLRYDADGWIDALIVVEAGEIALESALGASHRFVRGDMFCLTSLPGGVLRNRGRDTAVLVAVARRTELRGTKSVTQSLI